MAEERLNDLERLARDARRYADIRVDQFKLHATRGLATALGQVLSYLLIFAVLSIVLGLFAFLQLQWLNQVVGSPWGTVIVLGFFLVVLAVLIAMRKKLFHNLFVKLFINVFYDSESGSDDGEVL
jgi:uncharacterized membrane-anchored protein